MWPRTWPSRITFGLSSIWPGLVATALFALTVAAYARFLDTGFAATDSLPLVETSRFRTPAEAVALFARPVMSGTGFTLGEVVYRPFVSLTFGIDYLLWGLNATGYHLTNLGLHLITVGAVWLLLSKLGLSRWSSSVGAAMFALHPIVLATVPVIGRRDSIVPVTAFAWASVLILLAEDACGLRRVTLTVLSLLLAALALLSKESAFLALAMLPMLLASRPLGRDAGLSEVWKSARLAIPFLVLAAVVFAVRLQVVRGLGGNAGVDVAFVDFYRYGVVIGAYLRDLLWAFADLGPAPRALWLRLAGLIVVSFALTVVWLPRRYAVLAAAGALWIAAFGIFCAVLKINTFGWLAYFSMLGVALLLAAGLEGSVLQLSVGLHGAGRMGWRTAVATVASGALLIGLLAFAVPSLWASALFRSYPQWHVAGAVEKTYMQALTACVATAPDVSYVSLERVPGSFDDGRSETGMLGVSLVEQYTADSALRLAFPDREFDVHVGSDDTLHASTSLEFSCTRLPHGIELTARY